MPGDPKKPSPTDDLRMDYSSDDNSPVISGGPVLNNASDDEPGLDISHYTGPASKASSQFGEELDTFRSPDDLHTKQPDAQTE